MPGLADTLTTGTAPRGPRSRQLLPVYLTHAMVHVFIGLFPAVLIALRTQFDASYALLGAVFMAAMLVYGFGSIPVGLLLNRIAPLQAVRFTAAAASLSALLIALAPNERWFAVGLFLLGVSCAPYHTAGLTLVSRVSGNDSRMLGHHGMVGNIGLAVAPAFGALLAWAVSWRLPFAGAAALGAALTIVLFTRMPHLTDPQMSDQPASGAASAKRGVTYLPALALVFAITIALGFIYRGFATYLPSLAAQRALVLPVAPLLRGGLLASLVYVVGFFGQWLGGHLGGRARAEGLYAVLLALTSVLLLASFFASGWPLIVLLCLFSFVHFTTQPMDNTFTGKYTSLTRRSLGYGTSFALSFGFGSVAAWAGGVVTDAAGGQLRYVTLMLAGVAAVATVFALALIVVARRHPGT